MNYIKKLIKSILPIIIVYIIEHLIIIISSSIYTLLGYKNLELFVSNTASLILTTSNIIIIYILIKKYKYYQNKLNIKLYYPLISLGISISCLLNMLIFKIIPPSNNNLIPLYISILSSGIIGPILEEILFRYILLNKLKKFNTKKTSIIIATIIFGIIHINPIKIIYAMILGLVLNIIYSKTNNIKSSIIIHISANIISIFLYEYNIYILILSLINLLISLSIISKNTMK